MVTVFFVLRRKGRANSASGKILVPAGRSLINAIVVCDAKTLHPQF
ncbi:hypothetical protein [Crinalium epipsammum]|nr:hypothetical protein [Crinalium epipsammum]